MPTTRPPHTNDVRQSFALGVPYTFYIEGQNFDTATEVILSDATTGIVWTPSTVTDLDRNPTYLVFTSTPRKSQVGGRRRKHTTGRLTITVINPDGPDANSPSVDSYYYSP